MEEVRRRLKSKTVGTVDNSPAIDGWEKREVKKLSPVATIEVWENKVSIVPMGLKFLSQLIPSDESLGYFQLSLRDRSILTFQTPSIDFKACVIHGGAFPCPAPLRAALTVPAIVA